MDEQSKDYKKFDWNKFHEENDVEIGKHYEKVVTFNYWLNIYDDTKRTFSKHAKEFNIYRAGDYGCIIQMID